EKTFNFETVSNHLKPRTKAHYYLRSAMFGVSSVDYKGTLIIEKPAQLADTYLAHHTLLLSENSRARSVPALEIEADDVKAGHAATIGKVDRELLFYLKSRGIPEDMATEMLIQGFFEGQLAMIPDEKTQEMAREGIMASLPFQLLEPLHAN
ncbi:MAG TPA: SufD family Fe-S cluster assembly protein, partial [Candidatus Gracilibacteria bacterium]|nr:SufD family Fe-S cluster assembly protein [Candidatus Gracilibacteria bacterium]